MSVIEFLLGLLFPARCAGCTRYLPKETAGRALCDSCLSTTAIHDTLLCIVCRARLAHGKRICHASAPLRLAAISRYREPAINALITGLKYRRHTVALEAIDILISTYLKKTGFSFAGYAIIPIPLHSARLRRRGFNQSLLIAQRLAAHLHLPLITDELIRIRATLPQAQTKNIKERRHNLAHCFALNGKHNLTDRKIILVDDVCTSGTTLIEAANALKESGAKEIIGFTVAQTG